MDEKRLLEIANELRRMIQKPDESEAEQNISAAITYLDCARMNIYARENVYKILPQIVVTHKSKIAS